MPLLPAGTVARATQAVTVLAPRGRVNSSELADLVGNVTSRLYRNVSAAGAVNVSVADLPVIVHLRLPGRARDSWNNTAFRRNLTAAVASDLGVAAGQVDVSLDADATAAAAATTGHRRFLLQAGVGATATVTGTATIATANQIADSAPSALTAAGCSTATLLGSAPVRLIGSPLAYRLHARTAHSRCSSCFSAAK